MSSTSLNHGQNSELRLLDKSLNSTFSILSKLSPTSTAESSRRIGMMEKVQTNNDYLKRNLRYNQKTSSRR